MITGSLRGGSTKRKTAIIGGLSSEGTATGELNNKVKTLVDYEGLESETASVAVDNYARTIKVDVIGGTSDVALDEELLINDENHKATINPLYRSGYIAVDNIVKRNQIDRDKLEVGTRCYVKNEDKFYKLTSSTGDSKVWEDDSETDTFDRYASEDKFGTVKIGENLTTDAEGKLVVDVAMEAEQGSTKPISAGAVCNILGDIKVRLENI